MDHDQQRPPSDPRPTSPPAIARLTIWHTPTPDQPGCLSADLARRLLHDHTQTGHVVIDLDDDPTLSDVAAATGRGHRALAGHTHPGAVARHTGHADLVLLHWPRPAANPRHLLQTAHALLKATGLLAIAVHVPASKRTAHLIALTGAAHTAGFRPVRHIVTISPTDDASGQPSPSLAALPHTDLLIFQPQAERHG
jgi:hypothetical protein